MDRLGSGDDGKGSIPAEPESLLRKYDIPIDHLDFKYVESCNNVKELEQICHILQSGQEGHYPDLLKCTERCLTQLKPHSKYLRKQVSVLTKYDLDGDEWKTITNDVKLWVNEVNKNDKELLSFHNIKDDYNEVPIREANPKVKKKVEKKPERIKSMDYSEWDKLDVDAEMLKMEIQDEKLKEKSLKEIEEKEKLNTVVIKPDYMTEAELAHSATQEKNRGNEFYRSGDYEEALQYYTNSLNFQPTVTVYNNRSITYIKLNQYEDAIKDCNEVLKIESINEKALLRKALALKYLQKFDKAADCLRKLIKVDPNNGMAQRMMNSISEKIKNNTKPPRSVRLSITDENKSIETKPRNVVIPIPGTSYDKPPYYKVLNVTEELEEKYLRSCKRTHHPSDEKVIILNDEAKDKKEHEDIENMNNEVNSDEQQEVEEIIKVKANEYFDDNQNDFRGSGEPYIYDLHEISPYEFIKHWQSIKNDSSLVKLEQILRRIKPKELIPVIGNKLDGHMLGLVLKCLEKHFMSVEDAELLTTTIVEFAKLPRFDIVAMLLNKEEKKMAANIIGFTSSCGYKIPAEVCNMLV